MFQEKESGNVVKHKIRNVEVKREQSTILMKNNKVFG